MLTSRARRLSVLTLVGAALAAATLAPTASAATQRYAGPTGSGTACTSASPCGIKPAVEGAGDGDEVIVKPGDYPLTAPLVDGKKITIHGVAGQPRPRLLFSGPGQHGLRLYFGSTLRYVEIHQTVGGEGALGAFKGAKVDQVIAKAPSGVAIEDSTISNSVVVGFGTNARALSTYAGAGLVNTSTYRNVTAIVTGAGGVPIEALADTKGTATVHLVNVIAYGGPGALSLQARTDSAGAQATITATHTNFQSVDKVGSSTTFVDDGGNRAEEPVFVNAGAGDYRQAGGSDTIDAGLDDPANGAFDVEGDDPRRVGTTDIGADEFVAAPAATTGGASALTQQSAVLSGSVNPKGAPAGYHFEYGSTTAYGATTPSAAAGSGTGAVPAGATLGGLRPATTYHYRVVAGNAGGVTKGADRTFTTPGVTTAPPTSPPPTTPPVAPPFAGVTLVSTRLSTTGRFVTLKLSCPAATAGRCSGRTKLTARRRRTRSRPASRVTLGRAPFSIAAGKQRRVRIRLSRAGRRRLRGVRRLRAEDTNAARNVAGQSKTTRTAVTIRRRHR